MNAHVSNENSEDLRRRGEELKRESKRLEKKLEDLRAQLKKVTGRVVLPDDATQPPPARRE